MTDTRQPHEQQPYPGSEQQPTFNTAGYQTPAGMPPGGYHPYSGPQPSPYGQWSPQQQGQWNPQQPPQPKNSLAMPALILGIITLGLSPLPILNQAGILVGFVGAGLGIAALIIGLRRRVRVVMAAIALALSILGLISAFAFTQSFVNRLNNIGSSTSAAPARPAQSVGGTDSSDTPAAPPTYTFSITGSAKKTSVNWSVDGSSGSAGQSTKVPWTKTMTAGSDSFHYASLSANTYPGTPGDLTCTITDQTGRVLDTESAESQGGQFGSAMVSCSASGSDS
jgi:hypothetical protein